MAGPVKSSKGTLQDGLKSFGIALGLVLLIRWAMLEAYVIPSPSMVPSLLVNDHIFVNKIVYGLRVPFTKKWLYRRRSPERGEVVVFRWPENESVYFVKRVVGVPGDRIHYEQGRLTVNGQVVEAFPPDDPREMENLSDSDLVGGKESYLHFSERLDQRRFSVLLKKVGIHPGAGPLTVPEGQFFVMGDNRDHSNDSRYWGVVPLDNLLGRASFVWLSCREQLPGIGVLCHPATIRWSRLLHRVN